MGARAYTILKQFSDFNPGECVIEVGSERGEGSTRWMAKFCSRKGIPFYTIDIDQDIYEEAVRILRKYHGCMAHHNRGEDFIHRQLTESIRFAYLDGFDYIPSGLEGAEFIRFHRQRYAEMGLIMTNACSEASHLIQAALVDMRSASRCAILIDDTEMLKDQWVGKGALAMPYLESRGYLTSDLGGAGLAVKP